MVDMYGSQVRCQVRLGKARLGQVRLGLVRLGVHVWQLGQVLGQVRCTCMAVRLGQVRLGKVWLGQVYMYGNQVRCTCINCSNCQPFDIRTVDTNIKTDINLLGQVRFGQVRCTCMAIRLGVHVWQLGQVRLGVHLWQLGYVLGQFRLVQVRLGLVKLIQVRLGQVRLGQVRCTCMNRNRVVSDGSIYIINWLEFNIFDNFNCRKCRAD